MDAKEATRPSYGYPGSTDKNKLRRKGATWWLRSPNNSKDSASAVRAGLVAPSGSIDTYSVNSNSQGVSPAFNLNLESVIFSSVISGGHKLTIKDEDMIIEKREDYDITRAGNVVTVPYSITGEKAGNATQVSVLLTDREYAPGTPETSGFKYMKLEVSAMDTSGTGLFTLPDDYTYKIYGTDYHAYILAEDVNDGTDTDYASEPVEITIPDVHKYHFICLPLPGCLWHCRIYCYQAKSKDYILSWFLNSLRAVFLMPKIRKGQEPGVGGVRLPVTE